jgi:hypothetical protein
MKPECSAPQRARKRKCEAPHLAQSIAEALVAAAPQRASKPPVTQYVSQQLQFLPPYNTCALSPAARRCASEQARAIVRAEDPLLEQLMQVRAITTRRQTDGVTVLQNHVNMRFSQDYCTMVHHERVVLPARGAVMFCFMASNQLEQIVVVVIVHPELGRLVDISEAQLLQLEVALDQFRKRASSCLDCIAGKYSATVGATASSTCLTCAAGTYSATAGASSASTCLACPAGKYYGATGASSCLDCIAGKYSAAEGATAFRMCLDCAAGKYSGALGASSCLDCVTGKYSVTVAALSDAVCITCAAGKYSVTVAAPSDAACITCGAGKYSTAPGASSCSDCDAGKYSAAVGATASSTCLDCAAGKYSVTVAAPSDAACITCGAGKYSTAVGAPSDTACIACAAGKYSAALGVSSCLDCVPGKYSTPVGATASSTCLDCAAGRFSAAPGVSSCLDCVPGKYSTPVAATSADTCITCGAGKYSSAIGAPSDTVCIVCAAGKYSAMLAAPTATITCGGENCGGLPACSSLTELSGAEGSFSDVAGNYQSNANCWWALATSLDAEIRISFPYFDTELNKDWVEVYRCDDDMCYNKDTDPEAIGVSEPSQRLHVFDRLSPGDLHVRTRI